jgi:hypothetical protein
MRRTILVFTHDARQAIRDWLETAVGMPRLTERLRAIGVDTGNSVTLAGAPLMTPSVR